VGPSIMRAGGDAANADRGGGERVGRAGGAGGGDRPVRGGALGPARRSRQQPAGAGASARRSSRAGRPDRSGGRWGRARRPAGSGLVPWRGPRAPGRLPGQRRTGAVRGGVGVRGVHLTAGAGVRAGRPGLVVEEDRDDGGRPRDRGARERQQPVRSHRRWHAAAGADAWHGSGRGGAGGAAADGGRTRAEQPAADPRADRRRRRGAGGAAGGAGGAYGARADRALHRAHGVADGQPRSVPPAGGARTRRAGAARGQLQRDAGRARAFGAGAAPPDRGREPRAAHADLLAAGERPDPGGGRPLGAGGAGEPARGHRGGARRADGARRRCRRAGATCAWTRWCAAWWRARAGAPSARGLWPSR